MPDDARPRDQPAPAIARRSHPKPPPAKPCTACAPPRCLLLAWSLTRIDRRFIAAPAPIVHQERRPVLQIWMEAAGTLAPDHTSRQTRGHESKNAGLTRQIQ